MFVIEHSLVYFFQNVGENSTNTVNNSKRPMSIMNAKNHFVNVGRAAKLPAGPQLPMPGPTLLMAVSVAPNDSPNGMPESATTNVLMIMMPT